jgi:hypothetical protein
MLQDAPLADNDWHNDALGFADCSFDVARCIVFNFTAILIAIAGG